MALLDVMYVLNDWLMSHELGNGRVKLTLTFPTGHLKACAESALKQELQPDFVIGPHAEPSRLCGIEYAFETDERRATPTRREFRAGDRLYTADGRCFQFEECVTARQVEHAPQ